MKRTKAGIAYIIKHPGEPLYLSVSKSDYVANPNQATQYTKTEMLGYQRRNSTMQFILMSDAVKLYNDKAYGAHDDALTERRKREEAEHAETERLLAGISAKAKLRQGAEPQQRVRDALGGWEREYAGVTGI